MNNDFWIKLYNYFYWSPFQLDTIHGHLGGTAIEKNTFIRLACKRVCEHFLLLIIDGYGPAHCKQGPPWADVPGLYKKAGWTRDGSKWGSSIPPLPLLPILSRSRVPALTSFSDGLTGMNMLNKPFPPRHGFGPCFITAIESNPEQYWRLHCLEITNY